MHAFKKFNYVSVTNVPHLISRCLVFGCEEFCCQFIRRCWSGFQLRSFNHLQGKTWLVKKFIDCDIFSWVERNLVTKKKNGPILKVVKKISLCTFVGIINKVVNVESLIFFVMKCITVFDLYVEECSHKIDLLTAKTNLSIF